MEVFIQFHHLVIVCSYLLAINLITTGQSSESSCLGPDQSMSRVSSLCPLWSMFASCDSSPIIRTFVVERHF